MNTLLSKPMLTVLDTAVFCEKQAYQAAYQSVDLQRREKIDRYRLNKDKRLSLGVGVLFQEGLRNLGIVKYSLAYSEHGKPYLTDESNVFFNLSHSGTLAACVFYKKPIGMDIQKIKTVSENLIKKVTTKAEFDFLMNHGEEERNLLFFRLWTAKESYAKYLGIGLSLSLKKLEVTFGETLRIKQEENEISVVLEEKISDGYVVTMCYEP